MLHIIGIDHGVQTRKADEEETEAQQALNLRAGNAQKLALCTNSVWTGRASAYVAVLD